MLCTRKEFPTPFVICLLVVTVLAPIQSLFGQDVTPEYCSEGLPEAQNQLFMGGFDLAIALLEPCITANMYATTEELVQAYELIANVYIAINDEEQARASIASLLSVQPDYEPDPDQSRSDFVFLVEEMRSQLAPPTPLVVSITTDDLINTITWSVEDASLVTAFALYRGTHPDTLTLQATLQIAELSLSPQAGNAMQASYNDSDVAYATRYFYSLEAVGEGGNTSNRSDVVDITTPIEPAQPIADTPSSTDGRKKVSPWIFVGGGAVAGGLAILLTGGDGNGNGGENPPPTGGTLPGPPAIP